MEVFWEADRPLAKPEILELSVERSWGEKYIHRLLNSLLKSKAIRVVGKVQLSNKYSRMFLTTISANEYGVMQIKSRAAFTKKDIPELVVAMFEGNKDNEIIEELEQILTQMKERDE